MRRFNKSTHFIAKHVVRGNLSDKATGKDGRNGERDGFGGENES
jgi:hypothetical protein